MIPKFLDYTPGSTYPTVPLAATIERISPSEDTARSIRNQRSWDKILGPVGCCGAWCRSVLYVFCTHHAGILALEQCRKRSRVASPTQTILHFFIYLNRWTPVTHWAWNRRSELSLILPSRSPEGWRHLRGMSERYWRLRWWILLRCLWIRSVASQRLSGRLEVYPWTLSHSHLGLACYWRIWSGSWSQNTCISSILAEKWFNTLPIVFMGRSVTQHIMGLSAT